MRALLIEDSPRLQQSVGAAMRRSGFALDLSGDGEDGLWQAESVDYDLIILDLMLPKLDGFAILRRLREAGRETPILLLTARDAVEDRVRGLNAGADDYLTKPFALEELLARCHALCRRRYHRATARLEIDNLAIDTVAKKVFADSTELSLNPREYALLEFLALRQGEVVSRREIEEHIYDGQVDPLSNVVNSSVCVLRRILSDAGAEPRIVTRRGHGYVFESAPAASCDPSDVS